MTKLESPDFSRGEEVKTQYDAAAAAALTIAMINALILWAALQR